MAADAIWVNHTSKTGHCSGSRYYGKTKLGLYVTPDEWCTKYAVVKGWAMNKSSKCDPCGIAKAKKK